MNDVASLLQLERTEAAKKAATARAADTVTRIGEPDLRARGVNFLTSHEVAEIEACEQRAIISRCRTWSNVPAKFRNANLTDFGALPRDHQAEAARVARLLKGLIEPSYCPRLVLLSGAPGLGKTHLACGVINVITSLGQLARYDDARDLLDAAADAHFGRGSETWQKMLARYSKCRLIVIDEICAAISAGGNSNLAQEKFEQIIDRRYRSNMDTLLISNAEPPAFRAAIGDRLADRTNEGGGCILMKGKSVRGRIRLVHYTQSDEHGHTP